MNWRLLCSTFKKGPKEVMYLEEDERERRRRTTTTSCVKSYKEDPKAGRKGPSKMRMSVDCWIAAVPWWLGEREGEGKARAFEDAGRGESPPGAHWRWLPSLVLYSRFQWKTKLSLQLHQALTRELHPQPRPLYPLATTSPSQSSPAQSTARSSAALEEDDAERVREGEGEPLDLGRLGPMDA
ncbi:hypothetical protein CVT26_012414 [Gymnopilus dilepis]|uniref:Uncharacterized protein n=1 Tax=Gymnopilus dilepis TaxID=231916 RepID=A0A409YQI5_9AGAR|nr:hypothetical protein CVT26_012414 [Gymnopilus dilepis]